MVSITAQNRNLVIDLINSGATYKRFVFLSVTARDKKLVHMKK